MRWSLALLAFAAVALAVLSAWTLRQERPDGEPADLPPAALVARPVKAPLAGSASCAGRACHGSLAPSDRADRPLLNEYTTWRTRDPHASAYDTLLTERSRQMARQLGIAAAHESPRCLACHTTPAAGVLPTDADAAALIRAERSTGVGCEACHGNANGWLDAHTARSWASLGGAPKREHGMIPVAETAALAQRCADCHVGAPPSDTVPIERDVNHDLLAAGHPRLAFELSSFYANLPPHWRPKPDRPAQHWAVGQAVSAAAALELLHYRATAPHAPWPEFAEYDCFGCHHNLVEPSRRQQRTAARRGSLDWGTWYFALPPALAGELLPELAALAKLVEQPRSPRAAIAKRTRAAAKEMQHLAARIAARRETLASARARMDALLADDRLEQVSNWDAAEQTYLALWALNRTARDGRYQTALDALIDVRAYRAGWDGPRSLPGVGFSPPAFFAKLRSSARP